MSYYYVICHITILNLNCSKRILVLISIVELCFSSMIIHPISRRLIMMFPIHQVLKMIKSTCVVDSLNWKNGRSVITIVWTSFSPTDNSYSNLKQLSVIFVIKIVFLQLILFYTKNMFIYACLYLFVPFVISPILLILVYRCTLLNLMEVQKEQFLYFRNCIVYFITLIM